MNNKVRYTPEIVEILKKTIDTHTLDEVVELLNKNYGGGFTKQNVSTARSKRGIKPKTHNGHFKKGVPNKYSKGKKPKDYMSPSAYAKWKAGKFQKGNIPKNAHPIGTVVDTARGLEIKVSHGQYKKNWRPLREVLWEDYHGKIPDGYSVIHLNGDRDDYDIENLALLNKKQHWFMKHHNLYSDDRELSEAGVQLAHLDRAIRDIDNREE